MPDLSKDNVNEFYIIYEKYENEVLRINFNIKDVTKKDFISMMEEEILKHYRVITRDDQII